MSLDRSLRTGGGLSKHRNVLTRAERIARLTEKGKFKVGEQDPIGLPKVGNRRVAAAAKPKKEAAEEGETPAAPAPAAKK